jgi:hypothetical protein
MTVFYEIQRSVLRSRAVNAVGSMGLDVVKVFPGHNTIVGNS